jgi:hypothetical protein
MALWHIAFALPAALGATLTAKPLHYLNESGHAFIGMTSGGNLGFRLVFATAAEHRQEKATGFEKQQSEDETALIT